MSNIFYKVNLNNDQIDYISNLFSDLAKGFLLGIITFTINNYKYALFLSLASLLNALVLIYYSLELLELKK